MNQTKIAIAASIGLSVLATTLILPILAPLIRELHLTVAQGGLMLSIGSVVMVVTAPLWGALSERFGRKVVVVSGFLGILTGYVLYTAVVLAGLSGAYAATAVFLALTAARAFVGAFLSAVPTAAQALMADITTTDERSGGMAIIGAAMGLGLIVGPAVSGLLVTGGIAVPLFGAIAICAVGAAVAQSFMKSTPPAQASAGKRKTSLFSISLQPWLIAGILLWTAIATVQITAGFYFQDSLGLGTAEAARMLAIALTLVGLGMFAVQFLQVRVLHLTPRILILAGAGAGAWLAGLVLLLSTADALPYYLAYSLLGIGSGFLLTGVMAGASLCADRDSQGVAAGLIASSQGIGFIVGPAVSTALYEYDQTLPFWLLAGLMFLLVVKFAVIPLGPRKLADAGNRP